jgi:hypothetical protein
MVAPALEEAGIQGFPLAPVLGEADGLNQLGAAFASFMDMVPGVVPGAVVDADNFQKVFG